MDLNLVGNFTNILRMARRFLGLAIVALSYWSCCLLSGCGQNVFSSSETTDPAEDATIALENSDPDEAIKILEGELTDNPTEYKFTSILATAYAQRAGVEPLQFAQNFAAQSSSADDSTSDDDNQFTVMFAILPDPTSDNITDINKAVSLLVGIPAANRLPGDEFKLAMFQTAAVVMQTKAFDADLDGDLSVTEVSELTDAQASALLAQISSSEQLLASSDPNNQAMQQAATAVSKFRTELDAAEGDTDEEKLKNYLASSQSDASTSTEASLTE